MDKMYAGCLARGIVIFVQFLVFCVAMSALAHYSPDARLIFAIVVGLAGVWSLGNIICLISMVWNHEKAA